jgi:hypothetical protein
MNTNLDRVRRVLDPRALLAALAFSILCVSPALAAFEVEVGAAAEGGLPAPILSAMSVQLAAMKPFLGDPQAMGQALSHQALTPGGMIAINNNIAAALIIKRAMIDPVASAAVEKSLAKVAGLAETQASIDLMVMRQSLKDKPEGRTAFAQTVQPLERLTGSKDIQGTLDSIFTGSSKHSGESFSDPVLAQNASGSPKIAIPLKPATKVLAQASALSGKMPAAASVDPFIQQLNDDYWNAHGYNPGEAPHGLSKAQKIGLTTVAATLAASIFGVQGLITEAALISLIVGFLLVRRVTFRSNLTGTDMAGAAVGQVLRWGGALVLLAQIARLFSH